ncbi:glycosyltransferase family 2 protein [bacterium]|nr:glycosyltransferase family 2 protein [bacterium]
MPKFSLIVPFYNVEEYFEKCLESITNQTYSNFECLCVDDCGNDKSRETAEKFAKKDNRIKIITHEKNKGLSTSRNTGIDNAKGDYVLFIDSDDWIDLRTLEILNEKVEQTNADSIWFNTFVHASDKIKKMFDEKYILNSNGFYEVTPDSIVKYSTYAWNKVYKLDNIKKDEIRFPDGLCFEETEFYFKYFTKYKSFYYTEDCLYNYRKRTNSIVTSAMAGSDNILDMFDVYMRIFNYAKENNLKDEYKKYLCALLVKQVNNNIIATQHEKVIKKVDELFKQMDFPNSLK